MVQKMLKAFRRRLTNLTTRNRSLLLLQLPQEQFIDLHELNFLEGQSSFQLLAGLIAQQPHIGLCEALDPRSDHNNEQARRLSRIARTVAFIRAERGSDDLFVGWPFVEGKWADGTPLRGPLLLWPVSLQLRSGKRPDTQQHSRQWQLSPRHEGPVLNQALLQAYAHFNTTTLPDEVFERTFDDFPGEALPFRTALYEWLKTTPLALDFNSDLFEDALRTFPAFSKTDFLENHRNGELKLMPQAVLGIFPQAGSYLVRDYDLLLAAEGLTQELTEEGPPPAGATLPPTRETDTLTVFALDATQEKALRAVKAGQSVVVQGPPGTGKSQLIGNLIADFTARGKRVLLVSQKRAALDTVYERLKRAGLQAFVASVHDFQHDRRDLYEQLSQQIDQMEAYRRQNLSLDAILLEREFSQTARRMDQLTATLEGFREALFNRQVCGLSPKELYLTSQPDGPQVDLTHLYKAFHFDHLEAFTSRLHRYDAYRSRLGKDHLWRNRVSFAAFTHADLPRIEANIREVPLISTRTFDACEKAFGRKVSIENLHTIHEQQARWQDVLLALQDENLWVFTGKMERKELSHDFPTIEELAQSLPDNALASLGRPELEGFRSLLKKALSARNSPFAWLFFSQKSWLKSVAQAEGLSLDPADLHTLQSRLHARLQAEAFLDEREAELSRRLRTELWKETQVRWQHTVGQLARARKLYQRLLEMPLLFEMFERYSTGPQERFQAAARQLLSSTRAYVEREQQWRKGLSDSQLWASQQVQTAALLLSQLRRDFDLMQEMDGLYEQFQDNEKQVVKLLQADPATPLNELFQNSLRLYWLYDLEARYPILKSVSGLKMSQLEEELQDAIELKQTLSGELVRLRLREQTYSRLEHNRLGHVTTYRDLRHQVTKKRQIWPVRQLLGAYADEIFRLLPCWMASPETVSALFPMQPDAFDLVIFDEASQCFVEQGIPALLRGRQVVVSGDSQQLQPSDLYKVRFEEEPDSEPDLEVTSLLEWAARRYPQVWLRGHYRSRSFDLIDFSNRHFYKNQLQLLPEFQDVNDYSPGIQYKKIEGVWEKQTNPAEVRAVIEMMHYLSRSFPGQSIGIVTFNYFQQQLIEEELEKEKLPHHPTEPLFVKNLENVQGDERDIIVFSVGYAPNRAGRMSMNFGNLNAAGGENRLNVAITRARHRVVVVTSIWPEQLRVEEATHRGPRLLKAYLAYARSVWEGGYRPSPTQERPPHLHEFLHSRLQQTDPHLSRELPFADLAEKRQNRYLSVILTDDERYHEALSAKEAHGHLLLQLRAKGWPVRRIWSRQWWHRPQL